MTKTGMLACGAILAALTIATPSLRAQFPAPPPLPSDAPAPPIPPRDVAAEVKEMSKRYGLTDEQTTKIRAILEDHAQKTNAIVKDDSLSGEDRIKRLLATKDDEVKLVSEVLNPEQKKKYEADVHPSGPPKPSADGKLTPPSPNSN